MSEINIKITASQANFAIFADELGYQTEVSKTPEELALLTEPIAIQDRIKPNPESKQQFLERRMKEIVVLELYKKKANVIDIQISEAKIAEKAVLKTQIESAVGVTSVL